MRDDLISVLLPVRSWRTTTAMAINSILRQSYPHLELLLIGQSCLSTLSDNLGKSGIDDPRIRLIARQSPGIVNALNTGIAQSRGKFIARMDDDDYAYPERLRVQMQYLHAHHDIQLCAACVRFVDAAGTRDTIALGNQHYEHWLNSLTDKQAIANACFAENPMPHPTLLAHRDAWIQLGGYRDVDGPEDYDLILRAMLSGIPMGKPAPVLQDWREHTDRLTRTDKRYRRAAFVTSAAGAWVQQQASRNAGLLPAVWIAGTGKVARDWHDELRHRGVPIKGFVDMHRPGPQRSKRLLPIITYDELCLVRTDEVIISAITQPAGRLAIVEFFNQQGWLEGHDFIIGA